MPADFGELARSYDELRPANEHWWELVELLVELGDLRGRRVLDVGCGTGRLAAALAERYACKVWGVDPSAEMLEVARRRVPRGVALKQHPAEELPFKAGWFERATLTLVAHHLERPRAFAELRRVLAADGRIALATFDPASFAGYYLNRYFPSFLEIDRARFPTGAALEGELRDAGFSPVSVTPVRQRQASTRGQVLERIRGRHISTFQFIPDDEYAAGLELAERELPARVDYDICWLVAVAAVR